MRRLAFLLLMTLVPLAAGQNASTGELPVGTGVPGEQESLETEGAGLGYAIFVVIATVAFASAFAYAAFRYTRQPPGRGGPPSPPQ